MLKEQLHKSKDQPKSGEEDQNGQLRTLVQPKGDAFESTGVETEDSTSTEVEGSASGDAESSTSEKSEKSAT